MNYHNDGSSSSFSSTSASDDLVRASDNANLSRLRLFLSVALLFVTLVVYRQVGDHDFINLDDDVYVTENSHVVQGITPSNIVYAFTATDAMYWSPVTLLSHMTDVSLFGLNPRGHHLSSVFIHSISSVLLFLLLHRITKKMWQSLFVSLLFALHPLHVESVAWVAERKDVLSAFFFFLTLFLYSQYAESQKRSLYLLTIVSFVFALMSKPMVVTVPVVLLLIDFWPLGRIAFGDISTSNSKLMTLVKEKIPFFVLSLLTVAITVYAQRKMGAMLGTERLPLGMRFENAAISYVKYTFKSVWPHDLAVFYPFPKSIPPWQFLGAVTIVIMASVLIVRSTRRYPYLTVGWFWFLFTLLPVIGLTQAGCQAMADRFTYIPHVGLFIMVAWGTTEVFQRLNLSQTLLALIAAVVILACTVITWHQLGYWQDNITLYRHTLRNTTGNWLIHNDLGKALDGKGDFDGAMKEYQAALAIDPEFAMAHYNLGRALQQKGNLDDAIGEYQKTLALDPTYVLAQINLGLTYYQKSDFDIAIQEYKKALAIDPNYIIAYLNLGTALYQKGDLDAAIVEYQKALVIDPNSPGAHFNIGIVLLKKGDPVAAITEFQAALAIDPNFAPAQKSLEAVLAQQKIRNRSSEQ